MIHSATINGGYIAEHEENDVRALVGRKFEFMHGKVNILFGRNGSGKSSLLKTIGAHAFTKNGWTKLSRFTHLSATFKQSAQQVMFNATHLDANVDWDGSPVFYENFSSMVQVGQLGDMQCDLLPDLMDEVQYKMSRSRTSLGEQALFKFDRLIQLLKKPMTCEEVKADIVANMQLHSHCKARQELGQQWLDKYEQRLSSGGPETIALLLDEFDANFDVQNAIYVYDKLLPAMQRQFKCQIIVATHSPIVLLPGIFNRQEYNIISMDNQYTEQCLKRLTELL